MRVMIKAGDTVRTIHDNGGDGKDIPAGGQVVVKGVDPNNSDYIALEGFYETECDPYLFNISEFELVESAVVVEDVPTGPMFEPQPITTKFAVGKLVRAVQAGPDGVASGEVYTVEAYDPMNEHRPSDAYYFSIEGKLEDFPDRFLYREDGFEAVQQLEALVDTRTGDTRTASIMAGTTSGGEKFQIGDIVTRQPDRGFSGGIGPGTEYRVLDAAWDEDHQTQYLSLEGEDPSSGSRGHDAAWFDLVRSADEVAVEDEEPLGLGEIGGNVTIERDTMAPAPEPVQLADIGLELAEHVDRITLALYRTPEGPRRAVKDLIASPTFISSVVAEEVRAFVDGDGALVSDSVEFHEKVAKHHLRQALLHFALIDSATRGSMERGDRPIDFATIDLGGPGKSWAARTGRVQSEACSPSPA